MKRSAKISGDPALLEAALEGFELQRQRIDEQISHLRSLLGKQRKSTTATATKAEAVPGRSRRKLSVAARKRIAAAQKKRWAEFRKTASSGKQ